MKSGEKALELMERFKPFVEVGTSEYNLPKAKMQRRNCKSCALVCVEEMIKIQEDFYGLVLTEPFRERVLERVEYLESVKKYIQNY